MKKIIIIFSLIILIFPLLPKKEVFASVDAPDKPIEVECPPSYTGEKKCFVVTNPRVKQSKTILIDYKPPEKKEVRKLPNGRKITNHPYTWALGTAMGFLTSHSSTLQSAQQEFWSKVDEVDLAAGRIANSVSASTAEALQNAYELAISSGSNIVNLSNEVWEELFTKVNAELSTKTAFDTVMKELLAEKFTTATGMSIVDVILARHELATVVSIVPQNPQTETRFNVGAVYRNGDNYAYRIYEVIYSTPSSINYLWDYGSKKTYEEAVQRVLNSDFLSGSGLGTPLEKSRPSLQSYGSPSAMGTVAPIVPATATSPSRVVEIDGKKYYTSPNPSSPTHPDLEPMPQPQPDGTPGKVGTKIPGHTLIDEDGYPIDERDGTRAPIPITTPVTNPLPKDDPEYKTPTFPWLPTPTPTNPTNPNSNCNKCLPDLIPNFFGLFAVFFTFLLACIVYLGKLAVFILTIPMIPEKKFEGTIGKTFEFIKNLEIGGLEIYNTMLALVTLLFSFLIYKVIRRLW